MSSVDWYGHQKLRTGIRNDTTATPGVRRAGRPSRRATVAARYIHTRKMTLATSTPIEQYVVIGATDAAAPVSFGVFPLLSSSKWSAYQPACTASAIALSACIGPAHSIARRAQWLPARSDASGGGTDAAASSP